VCLFEKQCLTLKVIIPKSFNGPRLFGKSKSQEIIYRGSLILIAMNTKVRSFLLERARETNNETVCYQKLCNACELGLDMSRVEHREEIGRILGEISSYEYNNGRPLLSALVIRAGDNYEGDGFFKLAEKLGFGNWRKLSKSYFDKEQMRKCVDFWSDDSNYLKYKDA
jgi:hypothetical protein